MPDRTDHDMIVKTETTVLDMKLQLIGNGQPGRISIIEKRVGRLEFYLAIAIGAGTIIGWVIQ